MAFSMAWLRFPPYILASMLVSFGGLLFGLDTGTIGPLTVMPQFYADMGNISSTIHGLLVSSILIPASITSFFTGSIADRIGRVTTVSLGGLVFCVGTALEAAAQDLAMLFVGRCVTGVGEGLFLSTLVIYIIEISPAHERGMLASAQQLLITGGICVGYFVCYGTVNLAGSVSWRLPFAIHSVLAFTYGVCVYTLLPESPRWLKTQGKYDESTRCWERLGLADVDLEEQSETEEEQPQQQQDVEAGPHKQHHDGQDLTLEPIRTFQTIRTVRTVRTVDLERVRTHREAESLALAPMRSHMSVHVPGEPPSGNSWFRLFAKDVRMRTILGAFLMGMQQLAGIDGVLYYAPLLFEQAGLASNQASFLASGVSALLMMAVTIPAFLLADKWGRRTSVIVGGSIDAACMFIIGALYASNSVHADHGIGRWVVIVLIFVFALTFAVSWAVHIRIYASEIQPLKTRAPATSLSQTSNWIVNFLVALTTPIFLANSTFGIYFLFGGASLLTVLVCLVAMPETKGKSLEEIEEAFTKKKHDSPTEATALEKITRLTVRTKGVDSSRQSLEQ